MQQETYERLRRSLDADLDFGDFDLLLRRATSLSWIDPDNVPATGQYRLPFKKVWR
jgi:hypothetical protein